MDATSVERKWATRGEALKLLPKESVGAELGVLRGLFTRVLTNCVHPRTLYLVDLWSHLDPKAYPFGTNADQSEQERRFDSAMSVVDGLRGLGTTFNVLRMHTVEASIRLKDCELDWVLVDADHTMNGCLADLFAYYPKVKSGGYVLIHDWYGLEKDQPPGYGVVEAVMIFTRMYKDMEVIGATEEKAATLVLRKKGKDDPPAVPKKVSEGIISRVKRVAYATPKNVVLHFCQVPWLGSVPMFIRDMKNAFPEFHHVLAYMHHFKYHDPKHSGAMNELRCSGVQIVFPGEVENINRSTGKVSKAFVEQFDPLAIIMHNTPGDLIEGKWPFDWLKDYHTMTYHHMTSWPLVPVELDVFVSKELYGRGYQKCESRMKQKKFVPPCIDTAPFEAIDRSKSHFPILTVGRLHTDSPRRHCPGILKIFKQLQERYGDPIQFINVGGAAHYKDSDGGDWAHAPLCANDNDRQWFRSFAGIERIWMPEVGFRLPSSFMRMFDILLLHNIPEVTDTWSRVVTEGMAAGLPVVSESRGGPGEQVDHRVNGLVADGVFPAVDALMELACSPEFRRELGDKAREKAVANYGLQRLRDEFTDFFLAAILRG